MNVAQRLINEVKQKEPEVYAAILEKIRPHHLDSVLQLFECHLRRIDLNVLNEHREHLPAFCYAFIQFLKFPNPGDPYGIQLTCRITKSSTQGTLDSKHLQYTLDGEATDFNVDKAILDELALFTTQLQVFEFANRHHFATVFVKIPLQELIQIVPDSGILERGGPYNKCKNVSGDFKYFSTFKFILAQDRGSVKVLYRTSKDLFLLMRHLRWDQVSAFSDIRFLFQKCGIVCHFFNMVELVQRQLFQNDGSVYEKDVLTLMKYQCRSGTPLPLTRDGLANNPDRTPLEILSFEAPKKNFAKLSTGKLRGQWYNVQTSADKIFFGQQFNEGTGYSFALKPKE